MTIVSEKKNIKTFEDIEVGEVFYFYEEFYMKIAYSEYDENTHYNAVKMSSGILDEFGNEVEVQEVKSELKVKLL